MLNNADVRRAISGAVDPVARGLLRIGVSPDAITIFGATVTSVTALVLLPQGEFLWALLIIGVFAFSDLLDGTMARMRGTSGPWGNFLDSTLDRVTDGAIFAGLLWYGVAEDQTVTALAAAICLIAGFTISYSKARAESVGATANVGIAERAERLIVAGVGVLLTGLGLEWALPVFLTILAVLCVITVGQRVLVVRRQLVPVGGATASPGDGGSATSAKDDDSSDGSATSG